MAYHGMVWYGMCDTPRFDGHSKLLLLVFKSSPSSPPRSQPPSRRAQVRQGGLWRVCFRPLGSTSVRHSQADISNAETA